MPGVIGASIFSPRPARGYRFHSLQVDIIIVPSRPQKPGINLMKIWSPAASVFAAIRTLYYQNHLKNSPQNRTYRGCSIQSSLMHSDSLRKMASVATQPLPNENPRRGRDGSDQQRSDLPG